MVALSNCMVVGDQKKYLAMLLTLKVDVDKGTGEPSDALAEDSLFIGKSIGSSAKTATEVTYDILPMSLKCIQKHLYLHVVIVSLILNSS